MGLYVRHRSSFAHDTGPHPENASRLIAIEAELEGRDWLGLELLEPPPAGREEITRVHDLSHYERIEELCASGGGMIDLDTVAVEASWEAALNAAGGAIAAAERLLADRDGHSFAFCGMRPPGHHAERGRAMGFCLFNNIAIAVAHARAELGVERALILDWDVHHGNGTEQIFYSEPRVVYASIHQDPLYPGTGQIGDAGAGAGEGFNVNLPVPPGSGPDQFLSLVQRVVVPIAREYEPGLVAISAGYDAHRADPLAQCTLDEAAYAAMAATMRELAAGLAAPVLVCLEGGYAVEALAASVTATIEALGGSEPPPDSPLEPVEDYRIAHRRHWPAL